MAKKKTKITKKAVPSVATEPSVVALELINYTNQGLDRQVVITGRTLGDYSVSKTFLLQQEGRREEFLVKTTPQSDEWVEFEDVNDKGVITIKQAYINNYKEIYK